MFAYGTVHGRFQPYHRGHLDYTLKALARCEHLIVGITNADATEIVPVAEDPLRHLPESNLFTYFERYGMIRGALAEEGVSPECFSIVPFPIHHPERWPAYFPRGAAIFIRLFSEWGRSKFRRFEEAGYPVEVLDPGSAKEVSGQEVRQALLFGDGWEELVPPAVGRLMRVVGASERLASLMKAKGPAQESP